MDEPRSRRCVWRDEDTWRLIKLWRNNLTELRRSKRNKAVYENMGRELNRTGLNIGFEEIRNKIKNLSKKFREELLLVQNPNGDYKSDWKFYTSIEKILGQCPPPLDDYNISNNEPISELQSKSWLTIVSEPDLSLVKTETSASDSEHEHNFNYLENTAEREPTNMNRRSLESTSVPLRNIEQSDSERSHASVSSVLGNNKRKNKQLKRKYVFHSEILAEIKRSNLIAEKNDRMALLLAAEANKLLLKSNQIQEQLLNVLSNRL